LGVLTEVNALYMAKNSRVHPLYRHIAIISELM
jgi:hypothetical protein